MGGFRTFFMSYFYGSCSKFIFFFVENSKTSLEPALTLKILGGKNSMQLDIHLYLKIKLQK